MWLSWHLWAQGIIAFHRGSQPAWDSICCILVIHLVFHGGFPPNWLRCLQQHRSVQAEVLLLSLMPLQERLNPSFCCAGLSSVNVLSFLSSNICPYHAIPRNASQMILAMFLSLKTKVLDLPMNLNRNRMGNLWCLIAVWAGFILGQPMDTSAKQQLLSSKGPTTT